MTISAPGPSSCRITWSPVFLTKLGSEVLDDPTRIHGVQLGLALLENNQETTVLLPKKSRSRLDTFGRVEGWVFFDVVSFRRSSNSMLMKTFEL